MAHCSSIIVHCIDYRTQRTADRLRLALGISKRDCDRLAIAGGASSFEQLQHNLEISHRLHKSSRAILTVHEDCGAGAKKEDLRRAAEIARSIGFQTHLFYLLVGGGWEEVKF